MDMGAMSVVFRKLALEAGDKIMEIYDADDFTFTSKSSAS